MAVHKDCLVVGHYKYLQGGEASGEAVALPGEAVIPFANVSFIQRLGRGDG